MTKDSQPAEKSPQSSKIGDLGRAREERRRSEWSLPMSERLARVHELSRQMSAVKGSAQR